MPPTRQNVSKENKITESLSVSVYIAGRHITGGLLIILATLKFISWRYSLS